MPEPVLSVFWKDHVNELSSVYKGLLENNFLVDCTLSAEGQSLKAHRLVLSACSPYFQMLFHEETEKHAFVVLLHSPFETLKAIIEFVYQGEVQIPEGNLESFLTVAQSLQIKGLNGFTRSYNKNLSGRGTASVSHGPLRDYQDTSVNQSVHLDKGTPENTCQQCPHHTGGYTNVPTDSSVLFESCSASHEEVQTSSVTSLLQEHERPVECDEVSFETEISVKHEPLCAVFSETNVPEKIKSYDPTAGGFTSEMNVGSDVFHKQNVNQYSRAELSLGNVESSELPPPQPSHLNGEMDSERIIVNQREHSLPMMLVPKSELVEDPENREPMDDQDMSGNNTNEGTESASFEENLDQCSSAEGSQWEQNEATRNGLGQRQWIGQDNIYASPPVMQIYAGDKDHKDGLRCNECPSTFTSPQALRQHKQLHTGERPYRCNLCDKSYIQKIGLVYHMRSHTGERPYQCDLCEKAFVQKVNLVYHKRTHTGERPYRCDVCSHTFSRSHHLINHKRTHSGDRPYSCDVCGCTFFRKEHLVVHKRTHMR